MVHLPSAKARRSETYLCYSAYVTVDTNWIILNLRQATSTHSYSFQQHSLLLTNCVTLQIAAHDGS